MKRKAAEHQEPPSTPKRQATENVRSTGRSTRSTRRAASQSPDSMLTPSKRPPVMVLIKSPKKFAKDAAETVRAESDDELTAKHAPVLLGRSKAAGTPSKVTASPASRGQVPDSASRRTLRSTPSKATPTRTRQASPTRASTRSSRAASMVDPQPSSRSKRSRATPGKATPIRAGAKDIPSDVTPSKKGTRDGKTNNLPAAMEDVDAEAAPIITDGPDVYFEKMASKDKTSNNTLEKVPYLTQSECLSMLKSHQLPYAAGIKRLYKAHIGCFTEWQLQLSLGHTLCLYGYGSKKQLLEQFVKQHFTPWHICVTIQGYHPSTDMRRICSTITQALGKTGSDVAAVLRALDDHDETLIVLIHNIDGENLRNEKAQSMLVRILEHPRTQAIVSIDHVKAPMLWDARKTSALNLLYHDATTFEPYAAETALQPSIFDAKASKQRLMGDRGISWILQTLSQNAKTIFKLLLEEQISHDGAGVESTRLYELASRAFAVSSKSAFQAQLGEFLDHEIIVASKETN
ncbi:origin recognition complex subunit 2-domain-containing protein [Protomyces lactucae-debilis]|uniref:Origin recognition complex subunit 2 n=1 Tax=Protomyces lactucae-debilis TaxID=2754530 RepID=A0A1Y2EWG8_PROLT|nr:origin recognition complex subunit 2-domain-containing protein [Protomyces lactucae-debilis]ORY75476.1 origin recognition complex subunit 2-domain-containing protein [Protomyces lactucae-debilis]